MIRFLHTADLQLGKTLHEHSLIEDQRHILNNLADLIADPSYNALVIAGDVYDRSIPPPDAVRLFSPFLGRVKKERPDVEIFLISGNHDSASRLGFGRELFAELGVHFATEPNDAVLPRLVEAGGEQAAFFLLPFLNAGSLTSTLTRADGEEAAPLRSQSLMAKEAAARLDRARDAAVENGADHTVLAAHLFSLGGAASKSERSFLGNAELVDIDLFAGFDYIALGHLHKFQHAGNNAYYSGSPLAYSFSEASHEKVFLSVTLEKGKPPRIEPIPIKPLRKTTRITGGFASFLADTLSDDVKAAQSDYLEITFTDTTFIENPLAVLRPRFPHLLSIDQSNAVTMRLREGSFARNSPYRSAKKAGDSDIVDDFTEFLNEIHPNTAPQTESRVNFNESDNQENVTKKESRVNFNGSDNQEDVTKNITKKESRVSFNESDNQEDVTKKEVELFREILREIEAEI
jgi:exonuclease SbcD